MFLQRAKDELAERIVEVRSQKTSILAQLSLCVKAKEEIEERLYVKFAQVLNSKKKKIRALTSSIDKQGEQHSSSSLHSLCLIALFVSK